MVRFVAVSDIINHTTLFGTAILLLILLKLLLLLLTHPAVRFGAVFRFLEPYGAVVFYFISYGAVRCG